MQEEEEDVIASHRQQIEATMELVKREMALLAEVGKCLFPCAEPSHVFLFDALNLLWNGGSVRAEGFKSIAKRSKDYPLYTYDELRP
jgi:hypothetical protein